MAIFYNKKVKDQLVIEKNLAIFANYKVSFTVFANEKAKWGKGHAPEKD